MHQDLVFTLFQKYGEISIRTMTLEIEEIKAKNKQSKIDREIIELLYDLGLHLVSKTVTEAVIIKVKHEDKVLIIGDESVMRGQKTREQVIKDSSGNHYILLDANGDSYNDAVLRKDFTILPEDDESEVFMMDNMTQDVEEQIAHMITHFDPNVFAVQSHVVFVNHPSIKEKLQVQLCIVREKAAIPPGHCQIIGVNMIAEAILHSKEESNEIGSGFKFNVKGDA